MAITPLEFEQPLVELEEQIAQIGDPEGLGNPERAKLSDLEQSLEEKRKEIYGNLTTWQRIQLARHPSRPHTLDYVGQLFDEWTELHGDRAFSDDHACVAGFAHFREVPVAIIGQQKGSDVRDNAFRNYGSMHPEGYRKALRVMKLAEKFGRPIFCFIDTQGAFPGVGAEERGQAEAIARNIMEMSLLRVPIICVVIGEGGSGGALGIGIGDRMLMQENAYYSVISPEGCASILWRDAKFAPQAAEVLKLTSQDLHSMGVVDEIIPEPLGGAHRDPTTTTGLMAEALARHLEDLSATDVDTLLEARFQKYRAIGVCGEDAGE